MWKPKSLTYILAVIWIIVKLIFFYADISISRFGDIVTLNFGFILFIIYNALQRYYKSDDANKYNFLDDFKVALKEAIRYIVVIFVFLLAYYSFIEPEAKEKWAVHKKTEQIESLGGYDEYLDEIIRINEAQGGEPISKDDYAKTQEEHLEFIRKDVKEQVPNLLFTSAILLGLFFMACALSGIGAAIFKFFMKNIK